MLVDNKDELYIARMRGVRGFLAFDRSDAGLGQEEDSPWRLTHADPFSHEHWSLSSRQLHPELQAKGRILLPETRPEVILNWLIKEQLGKYSSKKRSSSLGSVCSTV